MIKQNYRLIIISFLIGYILASLLIYISGGISPLTPDYKERKITFLNSLNPFEPMSPAVYMIIFANK
ncbi:MAG: hypothetical protein ACP5JU_01060 [Minisyncoccia bacterium]